MTSWPACRLVVRSLLARHRWATLVLGLGLGLALAVPLAAWSTARRTDAAFPAFVAEAYAGLEGAVGQLTLCPAGMTAQEAGTPDGFDRCTAEDLADEQAELAGRADVAATSRYGWTFTAIVDPATGAFTGQGAEAYLDDPIVVDGAPVRMGNGEGRSRLIAGRLPRADADDEILANRQFMVRHGLRAGDTVQLGVYRAGEMRVAAEGSAPPSRPPRPVRVVGVVSWPVDLAERLGGPAFNQDGAITLGPAVLAAYGDDVAIYGQVVGFVPRPGADPGRIVAETFPGRLWDLKPVADLSARPIESVGRATHLQANGVRAFALVAGVAVALFGGQILARQVRRELSDRATLVALGLRVPDLTVVAALRLAAVAVIAVPVALAGAWLASWLGPVGIAAEAAVGRRLSVDGLVSAAGVAASVLLVMEAAVAGTKPAGSRSSSGGGPAARLAALIAARSPSGRLGMAWLCPVGGGPTATVRRTAAAATFMAATGVVAAATMTASQAALARTPAAYGYPWDAQVGSFQGFSADAAAAVETVRAVPQVTSAAMLHVTEQARVDGAPAVVLAVGPVEGLPTTEPVVTDGHVPLGPTEIAISRPLARALGKGIGDTVAVTFGSPEGGAGGPATLAVVGYTVVTSFFPTVQPTEGVLVHRDAIASSALGGQGQQAVLLGLDGPDKRAGLDRLRAAFPGTFTEAVPPVEVANLQRLAALPPALAGAIGLLAAASVAHALLVLIARARRDLATAQALGATRQQSRAAARWLAAALTGPALVAGAAAGVVVGRDVWRRIAVDRALDQVPVHAPLAVAGVVVAGLAIAVVTVSLPARRAAARPPADALRAE